ncbi:MULTISPECIES: hypothetical protein [Micrococcaceae]|uniref:Secreted protein n=1 Tax=Arthrobacter bambusae TaxID=1338426 RepID=A0ABV2PAW6_9MICC
MRIKILSAALCVGALTALSATPAFAAGQVEKGPENSNSICSYSGLNDHPDAAYPEGGRVQSYGQAVRQGLKAELAEQGESPSLLCNGHRLPWQEVTGSH